MGIERSLRPESPLFIQPFAKGTMGVASTIKSVLFTYSFISGDDFLYLSILLYYYSILLLFLYLLFFCLLLFIYFLNFLYILIFNYSCILLLFSYLLFFFYLRSIKYFFPSNSLDSVSNFYRQSLIFQIFTIIFPNILES